MSKKFIKLVVFAVSMMWLATGVAAVFAAERPSNIVLIMADDFGYECVGSNGGESYSTPNLDLLAAEGMRFTHAYSQPVCTPSRVKIMTGLSNVRNYVDFGLLKEGSLTFGHMLQQAGYRTAIVGKWQLLGRGEKRGQGTHPRDAGFDEYCLWQVAERNSRYWKPRIEQNGRMLDTTDEDYGPDIFLAYARDFISRHQNEAFFLYYPMALTHGPFLPTPDNKDAGELERDKAFAAMVAYADGVVGTLASHLESLGIADRTLLLFTGDNGTPRGIKSILNGRSVIGGKAHTTDAGTHVPLIASWPGTIKPGVCDDLVDFSDFVPTFAEVGGGRHPYPDIADGRSFLAQLKGEAGNPRRWFYCFYHPRTGPGTTPQRFVRNQRWKLYGDGRLFDVQSDPLESSPVERSTVDADVRAVVTEFQAALDAMPAELRGDSP